MSLCDVLSHCLIRGHLHHALVLLVGNVASQLLGVRVLFAVPLPHQVVDGANLLLLLPGISSKARASVLVRNLSVERQTLGCVTHIGHVWGCLRVIQGCSLVSLPGQLAFTCFDMDALWQLLTWDILVLWSGWRAWTAAVLRVLVGLVGSSTASILIHVIYNSPMNTRTSG